MEKSRYACPCCGESKMNQIAVDAFEKVESICGKQVLTSAYRCKKHNDELIRKWARDKEVFEITNPGRRYNVPEPSKNSQHPNGVAFDILLKDGPERVKLLKVARECGFSGFGLGATLAHLDMRAKFCIWQYR